MHAVILAAGCGRRMMPLSADRHKGLLPIGDTTSLDRLVEELTDADITAITVVCGHQADEVEAHLRGSQPDAPLHFICNPRYDTTNNIISLGIALNAVPAGEDLVLAECDLMLASGVLRRVCCGPSRNIALVGRFEAGLDGTVVSTEHGRITAFHRVDIQGDDFDYDAVYKTLNAYRFTAATVTDVVIPLVAACNEEDAFYETVISQGADLSALDLHADEVPNGAWIEIDDPVDLASARFRFSPGDRAQLLDRARGGHWMFDVLDFAHMANVRFPTPSVLSAMRHALPELIATYGSTQAVVDEKLSWLLQCDPARLVTLAGACQAYPVLRRHWAGARVAIPTPTFGEYQRIFSGAKCYLDRPRAGVDLAGLDLLADDHDLVVIVNPNNPTGTTIAAADLHALALRHPSTTILVDESFAAFAEGSSVRDLLEGRPLPNVLLLTSLGKALGVSGMRLGYLYCTDRHLLDTLARDIPIWGVGSQAEHLLELTLKARADLVASFQLTCSDREAFRRELACLDGIAAVHPSGGNFILFDLAAPPGAAAALCDALLTHHGIAIKDVSDRFDDGVGRIRVGVRLPDDNQRLIAALARHLHPFGSQPSSR